MSDKHWYETTLPITIDHYPTRDQILRALTIEAAQLDDCSDNDPSWGTQVIAGWTRESVENIVRDRLEEYGSSLSPKWFHARVEEKFKPLVLDKVTLAEELLGAPMRQTFNLRESTISTILRCFIEDMLGLKRLSVLDVVTDHIVHIPEGDFGLALPPNNRKIFDIALEAVTRDLNMTKCTEIIRRSVELHGQYPRVYDLSVRPIIDRVEKIIRLYLPDIAQCPNLGLFYTKRTGDPPSYDFCGYVCHDHMIGRENRIGEILIGTDGQPGRPRRCSFSCGIPTLKSF